MQVKHNKRLEKAVNSYVLAQGDEPFKRLTLLRNYLKAKKIAELELKELRDMVSRQLKILEKREKKDRVEAILFTKEGTPKKNRYGSAFCRRCQMYKDYEKECPYCGSLELTL